MKSWEQDGPFKTKKLEHWTDKDYAEYRRWLSDIDNSPEWKELTSEDRYKVFRWFHA